MCLGHDSIVSPNLHYAGAAGDALDGGAQKRRREAGTWEGNNSSSNSSKRVRRDDFQVEAADSTTSQYSSPASLYDPSLSNHAFAAHSSTTSTPYPSNQPAGSSAVAFANAADSSFPHPNVDPAIQAYNPSIGPVVHQHQHQHPQQHQFRDSDAAFTAYPSHTANPQFASPWGMPPHPSSRPYHSSPDQFFPPPNDYASTSMPSQTSYQPSLSAQDWTQPSYSYTGGTEHWNYQIDEPTVYGEDASLHLKIQSIPTLDNLSTQIIMNLAKGSLPDIVLLTSGRNYEESQAYLTRRNLFDQTRKVFTRASVFIDLLAVSHIFTASQQEVIRKANRATFISSILEGHDISFYDLDARFLDTFVPTGQRLLKWQAAIFLDLKTQAYIAALMNSDGPPEVLLNELFPADLEQRIIARHPDAANIAPSEQDFLDRARARKQYLLDEPPYEALAKLRHKYGWQDFLREFATCINKNLESIINNPVSRPAIVLLKLSLIQIDRHIRPVLRQVYPFPLGLLDFRNLPLLVIHTTETNLVSNELLGLSKALLLSRHRSHSQPISRSKLCSSNMLAVVPRPLLSIGKSKHPLVRKQSRPSQPKPAVVLERLVSHGSRKKRMPCWLASQRLRDLIGK